MDAGRFISVEGPDGSGKSSVIHLLKEELSAYFNRPIVYTREPGGSRIAEAIRHLMLDPDNTAMDARTEALLFAASRRQHLIEVVFPALEAGHVVVSDRYVDSSIAYQAYGRQLSPDAIYEINDFAIEGLWPQLTLYIDVTPELGLKRIAQHRQSNQINRLDKEDLDFHRQVRAGYLQLLEDFPQRMVKIDGDQPLEQVAHDCMVAIRRQLP